MAELARGSVFDRPWGRTLGALGLRGVSGQLTLVADGKHYEIAFQNGAVVGAASPIASDAAVRVALTGGLLSTTQVSELARKQAASPGRDEVDVIAEHLRLGFDQAMRLRRRTIAQRAARTFSVDKGEFVVSDAITLSVVAGSELDVRAIIYLGAKQNLSEARLAVELGLFGSWFRLKPEAFEDLPYFGFGDAERPVIDALMNGASLGDIEAIPEIDSRMVRATLYALCAASACNVEQTRGQGATKPPPLARAKTEPGATRHTTEASARRGSTSPPISARTKSPSQQPIVAIRPGMRTGKTQPPPIASPTPMTNVTPRASVTTPPLGAPVLARTVTPTTSPVVARTATPTTQPAVARTATPPTRNARASTQPGAARSPTKTRRLPGATEVRQLIDARVALLEKGTDHYALLGVPPTASADDIRKAYFDLARQLHPDRLAALGISDDNHVAHKLFAQLNTAFAIVSDAKRRADYDQILARGGEAAMRDEQAQAEAMAMRILQAEDAYKRGEMALRREDYANAIAELSKAVELNPDEPDFAATHAWAVFCAAGEKTTVARQTREALQRAIQKSPRAINPRFFLGRVERMLGRDKEALDLFKDVLADKPHHTDAQSEIRAIESRLGTPNPKGTGGGLFGRKR